jgi:hypothetical protein
LRALSTIVALLVATATTASAQVVYSNDFSSASTANLTATGGGVATRLPFADCTSATYCTPFLARANGDPFDTQPVTLSLSGLPGHTSATVAFTLFILKSWDGNRLTNPGGGPDAFTVTADGATLLNTSFSYGPPVSQCYPANCPADNPARSGAVENNTLSAGFLVPFGYGDQTYEIALTFAHSAPTLRVAFAESSNSQGWPDEGWAIDNLRVTLGPTATVPEPSALALVAAGLLIVGAVGSRVRHL